MSKYVVTGGAGFIGSALVRRLLAGGAAQVTVVDNLLTGKLENLDEVRGSIEFCNVDVRDAAGVTAALQGAEVVFHLAAIPSVPRSIDDPVPSHQVNIDGAFNVFSAARQAGARRVVYAASSSVYGDSQVLPKVENMLPQPKSPYAVQKLLGEYYATVFTACYGLETVSLRFFNVFGPRQDPSSPYSGVLSLFISSLLDRRSPTIFGDGEHSRDFTYVDDVADLCIKASKAPGVAGKVYNAGNGGRLTLNETWKQLCEIEGITLAPLYAPERSGDVKHSQADIRAAVAELGHAPRFSFADGLRLTLEWYRAQRATQSSL
jgi:nucleoside-diphosphate-sugar epimerase